MMTYWKGFNFQSYRLKISLIDINKATHNGAVKVIFSSLFKAYSNYTVQISHMSRM